MPRSASFKASDGVWFLAAGLAFGALAAAVQAGATDGFDRAVTLALRDSADVSKPYGPRWFAEAMRDITGLGSNVVLFLGVAVAATFLFATDRRHTAWLLIAAIVTASLVNSGLKLGFGRARPDIVPHAVAVYTKSFPSGHAFLSASVYLTLAAIVGRTQRNARVRAFILGAAVLITFLIGVSRVYLGVHWPTDVLAGWLLGGLWALTAWRLTGTLQQEGVVEPETRPAADPSRPDRT